MCFGLPSECPTNRTESRFSFPRLRLCTLRSISHVAAARDLSKARDVEYGAAFALALSGDVARSQALANDLEKASEDTYVRFNYLPTLRALWALSHGDSSNAIELLQIAAPYELAVSGSGSGIFGTSILCTCAARPVCWRIGAPKPPRNSRENRTMARSKPRRNEHICVVILCRRRKRPVVRIHSGVL